MITTDSGEQVEALAPIIISASRSTDIPAFYVKWFFNRLAKGIGVWYNSGLIGWNECSVSFERCKAIVFGQRTRSRYYLICMSWIGGVSIIISSSR